MKINVSKITAILWLILLIAFVIGILVHGINFSVFGAMFSYLFFKMFWEAGTEEAESTEIDE